MTPPARANRMNGRWVALALLALCITGFLGTVWNYSRNHAFAVNASLISNGTPSVLSASFKPDARIQQGQRVVLHISGDSTKARGGIIQSMTPNGVATIFIDDPVTAPVGSKATVSIDGTIAPQPVQ